MSLELEELVMFITNEWSKVDYIVACCISAVLKLLLKFVTTMPPRPLQRPSRLILFCL